MLTEIANTQHEIWSHWMRYQFSVCVDNGDGSLTIPREKVERWTRQMNTSYFDLSEKEQASDIDQARKVFDAISLEL